MKKQKKWMKYRHRIIRNIAYAVLYPYSKLKLGIEITPFREPKDRQYLILYNHQTVFDQFFVGMALRPTIYYLATEDIFSNGWISSLLRFAVAPIPIKKQTTDIRAVMNCLRVAKEGGSIALAPEGNRTYSGKTEYMNPAIAPLVKKLDLPLLLFRIEGGYGVWPRWSDTIRKGKMKGYVAQVIEPDQYKNLSNEQLMELITEGLYVNEAEVSGEFYGKHLAEHLERCIYICPDCKFTAFKSYGDIIECECCKKKIRYLPTKELEGVGFDFPFRFVNDWYEYQSEFLSDCDMTQYKDTPLYKDTANIFEVTVYKNKKLIKKDAQILLYSDKLVIDEKAFDFTELSAVTVLGRNKLNIYTDSALYQLKGAKSFNALKYVNIFYKHKNTIKGEEHVKFLGL